MLSRTVLLSLANSKKMESIVRKNALSSRIASRFIAGENIADVNHTGSHPQCSGNDRLARPAWRKRHIGAGSRRSLWIPISPCFSISVPKNSTPMSPSNSLRSELTSTKNFVIATWNDCSMPPVPINLCESIWKARIIHSARLICFLVSGTVRNAYRNTGVVIQSYLRRSADDIANLNVMGARVRLCKGAYKEPPTVAFPDKADVDANYIALMKLLLEGRQLSRNRHTRPQNDRCHQSVRRRKQHSDRSL